MLYLVEDDPAVRDSLRAVLESNGFEVSAYATAVEFLEALNGYDSGVVILDLILPDMTAEVVLAAIRAHGGSFPVIAMTGCASTAEKAQAIAAGVVTVMEKPLRNAALLKTIRKLQ